MSELSPRIWRKLLGYLALRKEETLIYSRPLGAASDSPAMDGVSIRLLQPGEERLLCAISPVKESALRTRLERGDRCYLGFLDGFPAHFSWVQESGLHPLSRAGRMLPVREREIWIYHCHTAFWARGRRLFPAALAAVCADYRSFRTAWIYCRESNTSSRRAIESARFKPAGRYRSLLAELWELGFPLPEPSLGLRAAELVHAVRAML